MLQRYLPLYSPKKPITKHAIPMFSKKVTRPPDDRHYNIATDIYENKGKHKKEEKLLLVVS